jgi:EAL domain-containing protein (putative c-di-GMP-specific phosphodiesterase class I)/GGDEF domain-containing protein
MRSIDVRKLFLLAVIACCSGLSFLFVDLYRDGLSLNALTIAAYFGCLFFSCYVCWQLSRYLFKPTSLIEYSGNHYPKNEHVPTFDSTTNLPTAQQALLVFDHAITTDNNSAFAAIVFKPINFKEANTLLGHHNSDLLLLQLAYCLQLNVTHKKELLSFSNSEDSLRIARLQGLNFLVVLNLSSSKHEPKAIINALCKQLMDCVPEAMSFKSYSLNFELAFGVSLSTENGSNAHEIVAHAEDALLDGVKGNSTVCYFDNKKLKHTQHQLVRMEKFRNDVEDENLHWYIQPQVNITDNSLLGFQLKVHWYEAGTINPLNIEDFSLLAEHSGEIYPLAKQMFKHAFKALYILQKNEVYLPVSVSLPCNSLFQPDLVDFIEHETKKHNVPCRFLMVELSESVILKDPERARQIINQLKSLDVAIAITNFSGSFESLRYVRKMAIHQIKINCQKLTDDSENRVDKAITNALITLTRSMKLTLVGTDIDRLDASNAFTSMGGIYIQGSIISSGVVLDELTVWLQNWYKHHLKNK